MRNLLIGLIIVIMTALTSCSVFSPIKTEPQTKYLLNTLPHAPTKNTSRHITLLIGQPEASPVYDTKQMVYISQPYEIAYYAKNEWAEKPTDMLQSLLTQTLQNTHYFHAIVSPPFLSSYNYVLNTEIQRMEIDFTHTKGYFYLTIRAQIIGEASNKVVATNVFSATIPMQEKTPYAGVVAGNAAMANVLKQISHFCLNTSK
jgi:cholesterol transport system auxiliary component